MNSEDLISLKTLLLVLVIMAGSAVSQAGTWSKLSDRSISFTGEVEEGDFASLKLVITNSTERLILNSPGGNAVEGLKIGQELLRYSIDTEVQGICISSCANYLFPVGHRKIISHGVVGYHGNITAVVTIGKDEVLKTLRDSGLSDEVVATVFQQLVAASQIEAAFYSKLGISQTLFDRTYSRDKGMGDGKAYLALAPTLATFEKYGFKGVEGEESLDVIANDPILKKAAQQGAPMVID